MGDTVILTSIAIKKVYYITPFIYFVMLAYTEAVCTDNWLGLLSYLWLQADTLGRNCLNTRNLNFNALTWFGSIYCQTTNKNLTHVLQVVASIPAFHPALEIWQQSLADQQRYLIACSCTQQAHGRPPYNKIFMSYFTLNSWLHKKKYGNISPWRKKWCSYSAIFVDRSADLTALHKITQASYTVAKKRRNIHALYITVIAVLVIAWHSIPC